MCLCIRETFSRPAPSATQMLSHMSCQSAPSGLPVNSSSPVQTQNANPAPAAAWAQPCAPFSTQVILHHHKRKGALFKFFNRLNINNLERYHSGHHSTWCKVLISLLVFVCVCMTKQAGKSQSAQFSMGNFSAVPSSSASSSFGQMGGASANVAVNTSNYSQMNAHNHQAANGYGKSSKTTNRLSRFLYLCISHTISLSHPR